MRERVFIIICVLSISVASFACDNTGKTGFFPKNTLRVPVDEKNTNGMTETVYNRLFERVYNIYEPIFRAQKETLTFLKAWKDETVNAFARKNMGKAVVAVMGGLARHPKVTRDAVLLTICHELGHHIGGSPVKSGSLGKLSWASNEGQADYFGVMKCLRKVFEPDDNISIVKKLKIPSYLVKECALSHSTQEGRAVCVRSLAAGYNITSMFTYVTNENFKKLGKSFRLPPVSFVKRDKKVVRKTDDAHPKPQCRMDTFIQGALCDKDAYEDVSYRDQNIGVCSREENYRVGIRPLCWYRPSRS